MVDSLPRHRQIEHHDDADTPAPRASSNRSGDSAVDQNGVVCRLTDVELLGVALVPIAVAGLLLIVG